MLEDDDTPEGNCRNEPENEERRDDILWHGLRLMPFHNFQVLVKNSVKDTTGRPSFEHFFGVIRASKARR